MKKRLIRELFDRGKKNPKLKMSRKSESQMKKDKIWIFAGTTEGRLLTRYASQMKMKCCVSTATEYGKAFWERMRESGSYPGGWISQR